MWGGHKTKGFQAISIQIQFVHINLMSAQNMIRFLCIMTTRASSKPENSDNILSTAYTLHSTEGKVICYQLELEK